MKAQVAMEFLIFFSIFIMILIIVFAVNFQKTAEIRASSESIEADRLIGLAADRINTVFLEGQGFSSELSLPPSVGAVNYSVSINGSIAYLVVREDYYQRTLMTSNVQGQLMPGRNIIRNSNGTISVSQD